jgi:hypothetical protein
MRRLIMKNEISIMKIVVIGGSGLIGSKVVTKLREHGHQAVAASPNSGVNTLTGEGLEEVLEGASVVVDVSNSPSFEDEAAMKFFDTATRNLLNYEAAEGVGHHIALSVVGSERMVESGYFRAKITQENLIKGSSIPYSIVRATWYPGVVDKTQATIIELERAQELSGYTIKLPRKLTMAKRRVQGTVTWPDGRPAAWAGVYLDTEAIPGGAVSGIRYTDANGKFDLSAYEGMKYRVMAFINSSSTPPKSFGAEPIVIELNEDTTGIALVLSLDGKTWGKRYLNH